MLGGVRIPSRRAPRTAIPTATPSRTRVTDAILGAAALGDIGEMFPDTDPANAGRDSIEMLRARRRARRASAGWRVQQVDVTVIAETPTIGPHRDAMRDCARRGARRRRPATSA